MYKKGSHISWYFKILLTNFSEAKIYKMHSEKCVFNSEGGAENAGPENGGPENVGPNFTRWNLQDWKMQDQ